MRRRNWSLILPATAIAAFAPLALAGFAVFGVLAAFLAPIVVVTVFAWRDWQERQAAEEFENARLAAFIKARDAAPQSAPAPASPPAAHAVTSPATMNPAVPVATMPSAASGPAAAANAATGAPAAEHAAAHAILQALKANDRARATALFLELGARRRALELSPADWGRVGAAALEQGAFLDAAWALHAGALLAGDEAAAQKHLLEVAGKASAAGDARVAFKLYGNLLKKYPSSPYAELARKSMRIEQKKTDKR